jgi:hypothetical protein
MKAKKDQVLFKDCKIKVSYSKLNNRVMRNKSKTEQFRKVLNELDPRFEDMIKMMGRTKPVRYKDLKEQLKKEREAKKKHKSK